MKIKNLKKTMERQLHRFMQEHEIVPLPESDLTALMRMELEAAADKNLLARAGVMSGKNVMVWIRVHTEKDIRVVNIAIRCEGEQEEICDSFVMDDSGIHYFKQNGKHLEQPITKSYSSMQ